MQVFKVGEKVWIEKIYTMDNASWVREKQTVAEVYDVPCDDVENSQVIYLKNIPYGFVNSDLRKDK